MSLPNNLSIVSIPAYYVLSVLPHAQALRVATQGKPATWDNRNPRGVNLKASLKARLPPDVFAQYERCEAASSNCYENMPLYFAAIVLGNLAKLDKKTLDDFALRYLVVRAVYVVAFCATSRQRYSYLRTFLWGWSVQMCFKVLFQSARAMEQ